VIQDADLVCDMPAIPDIPGIPDMPPADTDFVAAEAVDELSLSGPPSHDTYTVPSRATWSASKLCDPNTDPSVTVTAAVHVFPPSADRMSRNADRGKRSPGTILPTVYTAYSEPSGAYLI
jgi:hypothetical protein